jgi:hypothetical protein
MWNRLVLGSLTILACSAATTPASSEPPPRVFVEALVVEAPASRIGELGTLGFAKVRALPDVFVIASPNLIAPDRTRAEIAAFGVRLAVTPEVLTADVRLSIRVNGSETSTTLRDAQTVVITTSLPASHGGATFLIVRPNIIRDERDLRRVFERMHEPS